VLAYSISRDLSNSVFGEGIAVLSDQYFLQLTWKSGEMYMIDRETLALAGTYELFSGISEGWGITSRPQSDPTDFYELFISDGTSVIKVVDWDS
jgi:glutamine cyclotransferase